MCLCVCVCQRDEKKERNICAVSDKCQTGDNKKDGKLGSWTLKETILTVMQKGVTGIYGYAEWRN